jgi:hypothetical protein
MSLAKYWLSIALDPTSIAELKNKSKKLGTIMDAMFL